MKVKPSKRSGEVVLELGRRDEPLLTAAAAPEFKIKRILVPLDFSECSKKALRYALALARQHSAALDLVYVVPLTPYSSGDYGVIDYSYLQEELEESAGRELRKTIADEIVDSVAAGPIIRTGAAAREIIDVARSLPSDLIVISTHGRSGLKHVLLGSVAEQVVRHAPCPVLVVRESEHECLRM
jgi:nucleotide-binding universal stress UspA family protein